MERCDGCGACVEVCPTGAIYLVDGKAMVDGSLCRDCEACIAACPTEAIALAAQGQEPSTEPVHVIAPRPEPEITHVETLPAPAPLRARVLPVVGTALVWAGREIVPRLADYLLYGLDRSSTGQSSTSLAQDGSAPRRNKESGARQRRRRRRGG